MRMTTSTTSLRLLHAQKKTVGQVASPGLLLQCSAKPHSQWWAPGPQCHSPWKVKIDKGPRLLRLLDFYLTFEWLRGTPKSFVHSQSWTDWRLNSSNSIDYQDISGLAFMLGSLQVCPQLRNLSAEMSNVQLYSSAGWKTN